MPIYAYKCDSCGHAKDVLQKMSDDPLTKCPSCGAPTFHKQLTAAGFQLKGNGWYATDFKGGSSSTSTPAVAALAPALLQHPPTQAARPRLPNPVPRQRQRLAVLLVPVTEIN